MNGLENERELVYVTENKWEQGKQNLGSFIGGDTLTK